MLAKDIILKIVQGPGCKLIWMKYMDYPSIQTVKDELYLTGDFYPTLWFAKTYKKTNNPRVEITKPPLRIIVDANKEISIKIKSGYDAIFKDQLAALNFVVEECFKELEHISNIKDILE